MDPEPDFCGLNKAYLIGHVVSLTEMQKEPWKSADSKPSCHVQLSTPNARKVDGEWVDVPDYHRILARGEHAEFLARHAQKGSILAVECVLRPHRSPQSDGSVSYDPGLQVERILWLQAWSNGG